MLNFSKLKLGLVMSHIQTFYRGPKLVSRFAYCNIKKFIFILWNSQTAIFLFACSNCIGIRFNLTL